MTEQRATFPDTLWCYGNHDVSYPWGRLETGYSPYAEWTVLLKFEELENSLRNPAQINIMQRIDNAGEGVLEVIRKTYRS